MEETFANYILNEQDWIRKMEIMYYLEKKGNVFFDKTVILKTELVKLFIDVMDIKDINKNIVITASLLCDCRKPSNFTDISKVKSYAQEGAKYLENLGFSKRFCKICEEVNRYTKSEPREKESDILELVDNFGGMILDRFDRIAFKPDEALLLLEYRNLKGKPNVYLEQFIEFVEKMQKAHIGLHRGIEYLSKIINTSRTTKVALLNSYNSERDIKIALQKIEDSPKQEKEEYVEDIKINPEEIETIVLKRS
ncbi:MAG: hypothetical protein HFJ42_06345 [Clostridia bacterium]|nr:hypothetical protein [Clostridia bacterium]